MAEESRMSNSPQDVQNGHCKMSPPILPAHSSRSSSASLIGSKSANQSTLVTFRRNEEHLNTLLENFDTLRKDESLLDCCLVCEGQVFKGHKLLLAASSAYFKLAFTSLSSLKQQCPSSNSGTSSNSCPSSNSGPHDVTTMSTMSNSCSNMCPSSTAIILKDMKFQDLKSIMEFMYKGHVTIDTSRVGDFLKAADSLKILGLVSSSSSPSSNLIPSSESINRNWSPPMQTAPTDLSPKVMIPKLIPSTNVSKVTSELKSSSSSNHSSPIICQALNNNVQNGHVRKPVLILPKSNLNTTLYHQAQNGNKNIFRTSNFGLKDEDDHYSSSDEIDVISNNLNSSKNLREHLRTSRESSKLQIRESSKLQVRESSNSDEDEPQMVVAFDDDKSDLENDNEDNDQDNDHDENSIIDLSRNQKMIRSGQPKARDFFANGNNNNSSLSSSLSPSLSPSSSLIPKYGLSANPQSGITSSLNPHHHHLARAIAATSSVFGHGGHFESSSSSENHNYNHDYNQDNNLAAPNPLKRGRGRPPRHSVDDEINPGSHNSLYSPPISNNAPGVNVMRPGVINRVHNLDLDRNHHLNLDLNHQEYILNCDPVPIMKRIRLTSDGTATSLRGRKPKLNYTSSSRDTSGKNKCPHCPQVYYSTQAMNDHVNNVHSKNSHKYSCKLCSKEFSWKISLNKHLRKLHGEEPRALAVTKRSHSHDAPNFQAQYA